MTLEQLKPGAELAGVSISTLIDDAQGLARYQGVDAVSAETVSLELMSTTGLNCLDSARLTERQRFGTARGSGLRDPLEITTFRPVCSFDR